ncbi:MAG: TonB family protein [Gemmatimonadetes bacterium]|nr:TonB family protein [Gemmatimonadota bacterium]MDA1104820.1 TonB family protein [Gemmatimonadota bacterium]
MTAQRAIPLDDGLVSANDRFKGRFRSLLWSSIIFATLAHFSAFAFWPELTAEDFSFTAEELTAIELPPEVDIPPPPAQISRPATPVMATTEVDEEITIAPTTFETNPVEALPPPPELKEDIDISQAPTFTPFTVAPSILNRSEIIDAMLKSYPPLLRDAGIGGEVRVYFFIDAEGRVQTTRLDKSSGHQMLDEAAMGLASLYRFSPGMNRDQRVPVWVSFPILFQVTR